MSDRHPTHYHVIYSLTCAQYDELLDRAAGACELCRRPWSTEGKVKPQVDHDHFEYDGAGSVRGILCARCNAHMRRIDAGEREPNEATAAYVARAWWLTARPDAGQEPTGLAATLRHYRDRRA